MLRCSPSQSGRSNPGTGDADVSRWPRVAGRMEWIAGGKMLLVPRSGGISPERRSHPGAAGAVREPEIGRIGGGGGVFSTDGRRMIATGVISAVEREERVDGAPVAIPDTAVP